MRTATDYILHCLTFVLVFMLIFVLSIVLLAVSGYAQSDSTVPDATLLMKKSHLAYYYAGDDGSSNVIMHIVNKNGKERRREFSMLRIDIKEGGDQKYFTYFKKPSDIARFTFMVHKYVDKNDRRWIYIPAVDLIKPISADDKNSSFVGSDFTYEDVSGRHWSEDNHRFVMLSILDSTPVYVIESTPVNACKGFSRKLTYLDTTNYLPLREEYFTSGDKPVRIFYALQVEIVDGYPTITKRKMENVRKGTYTLIEFESIAFNVGLTEKIFTERYLKSPPRKFIK